MLFIKQATELFAKDAVLFYMQTIANVQVVECLILWPKQVNLNPIHPHHQNSNKELDKLLLHRTHRLLLMLQGDLTLPHLLIPEQDLFQNQTQEKVGLNHKQV
jgi:hypothetical protein